MITTAIVSAVLACLDAVFSLLPNFTLDLPGTSDIWRNLELVNGVFPAVTLARQLTIYLSLLVAIRLWDFGVYVYHQFWGGD